MPRVTEVLRNAQILAEFSNLEPAQVDYFRHNYTDFLPSAWWDHRNGEQWRMTQGFLRESWDKHFTGGAYFIACLILSVFDPDDLIYPQPKEQKFIQPGEVAWGAMPFQMAVLHLFEHPWRARFCQECRKRFVAVEPKNKFCGPACSDIFRTRQKREWWHKHGNTWRRKQKFKKTKKGGT